MAARKRPVNSTDVELLADDLERMAAVATGIVDIYTEWCEWRDEAQRRLVRQTLMDSQERDLAAAAHQTLTAMLPDLQRLLSADQIIRA